MGDNITKHTPVEGEELKELLSVYQNEFSLIQLEALLGFWYGLSAEEVAKFLGMELKVIEEWLLDIRFNVAVNRGVSKRAEIISNQLNKLRFLALRRLKEALLMDIKPESKGFGEQLKVSRWLVERPDLDVAQVDTTLNINEATAKLIAKELAGVTGNNLQHQEIKVSPPKDLADLLKTQVIIEGEFTEEADKFSYFNFVTTKNTGISQRKVNILIPDNKMQCGFCGKWVSSLGTHLRNRHDFGLSFYKEHFDIPSFVPLSFTDELLDHISTTFGGDYE